MKLTPENKQVWTSVKLANHLVDFEVIESEENLYTLTRKGYIKLEKYTESNLLEIDFWGVGSRCDLPPFPRNQE